MACIDTMGGGGTQARHLQLSSFAKLSRRPHVQLARVPNRYPPALTQPNPFTHRYRKDTAHGDVASYEAAATFPWVRLTVGKIKLVCLETGDLGVQSYGRAFPAARIEPSQQPLGELGFARHRYRPRIPCSLPLTVS